MSGRQTAPESTPLKRTGCAVGDIARLRCTRAWKSMIYISGAGSGKAWRGWPSDRDGSHCVMDRWATGTGARMEWSTDHMWRSSASADCLTVFVLACSGRIHSNNPSCIAGHYRQELSCKALLLSCGRPPRRRQTGPRGSTVPCRAGGRECACHGLLQHLLRLVPCLESAGSGRRHVHRADVGFSAVGMELVNAGACLPPKHPRVHTALLLCGFAIATWDGSEGEDRFAKLVSSPGQAAFCRR